MPSRPPGMRIQGEPAAEPPRKGSGQDWFVFALLMSGGLLFLAGSLPNTSSAIGSAAELQLCGVLLLVVGVGFWLIDICCHKRH